MQLAETLDQITLVADERLRRRDRKVLLLLAQSAVEKPGEFLSMSQIAEAGGWQADLDNLQVKNNVQRAICEIRQQFGWNVVLRQGNNYCLHLEQLANRLRARAAIRGISFDGLFQGFSRTIGVVFSEAYEAAALNRLLLWEPSALLGLLAYPDSGLTFDSLTAPGSLSLWYCRGAPRGGQYETLQEVHKQRAGLSRIGVVRAPWGLGICSPHFRAGGSFLEPSALGYPARVEMCRQRVPPWAARGAFCQLDSAIIC